jgi:glycosyltransferase involved in cell wall biosynthesis
MRNKAISPVVSVIIPTFNRGWVLKDAIDSVLLQEFEDFELIVVDDGSTDNTKDILDSFKEKIIVLRQSNRGVSSARNAGVAKASGEFIAFLDSDDLWLPGKLSVQVDFFRTNPDALICQTEETWVRKGVKVNPKKRHKKPSGMIFEPSLALCLVSPSAVMMKRILFDDIGLFDENLFACEDYDLWLRTSCRHPVFLIDTPMIIKRGGHDDQLSKQPGLDKFRIQSLVKILEGSTLLVEQKIPALRMLKKKCTVYANGCEKRGRMDEAEFYRGLTSHHGYIP